MKKVLLVLLTVGVVVGVATPAYADSTNVVREDSVSSSYQLGGTAEMATSVDIVRDTNGTTGTGDDRFNFGGTSVDVDVQTDHNWFGLVFCSVYGISPDNASPYNDGICVWPLSGDNKINWTEITIRKLVDPDHPGQGYETHWQQRYNTNDMTSFYLPQTSIDYDRHPFVRVEVDYDNSYAAGNPQTKSAWVAGWES